MKNLKQQLSDEISKGKALKRDIKLLFYGLLIICSCCAAILILFRGIGVLIAISIVGLVGGVLLYTSPWVKEDVPTDDEIKALAQKKIDEMDVSEDMLTEIDEQLREKLKMIINE